MQKNPVLKIVNPILAVLLLNQVLSGLLREAMPRAMFEVLHQGGGILFAVLALLHVILNWNWVKANFFKRSAPAKP